MTAIAVNMGGKFYLADGASNAVRRLHPVGPVLSVTAVTNGASRLPGPIAPGEVVVITGSGLGPADVVTGPIDDPVATFDGVRANLIYAEEGQVTVVVPAGIAGKSNTQVRVQYKGETSSAISVAVSASAPGLFTLDGSGSGQGTILNQDGTANLWSNPAAKGSTVTLFATGAGQLDSNTIIVGINSAGAEVVSIAPAPGLVGVVQIGVIVPSDAPSGGDIPVIIEAGGVFSQPGVNIAIE